MGQEVSADQVGREQRRAHREKLHQCLQVLESMLGDHASGSGSLFESAPPLTGMEVELVLVDDDLQPHRGNAAVLAALAGTDLGPDFQPEIGAHTLELNVPPGTVTGDGLAVLEQRLRDSLNGADARARTAGARILMLGVLPTLAPEHLTGDWMTSSVRYRALQEAVLGARGEQVEIDLREPRRGPGTAVRPPGAEPERLSLVTDSIAAESACTSTQLHLKVAPEDFGATYNAAQLLMGPQVALGANSPFALGRRLWAESRVELFAQSVDTRTPELVAQGVRPRTFVGEGWAGTGADAVLELFDQNVRWFPPLLPQVDPEDPVAELEAGRAPHLRELNLHSGTVWRWNRPVYDVVDGRAHLRVENRVLPAGPTVVDAMANAALYYGALRVLTEDGPDPAALLDPAVVPAALTDCARRGLDGEVVWPGRGRTGVRRLLLDHLLPMAAEGLARWGVPGDAVDRYLGVAQARARTGRTGARWQVDAVAALEERGADRAGALQGMLARYAEGMAANEPVHTWPLP